MAQVRRSRSRTFGKHTFDTNTCTINSGDVCMGIRRRTKMNTLSFVCSPSLRFRIRFLLSKISREKYKAMANKQQQRKNIHYNSSLRPHIQQYTDTKKLMIIKIGRTLVAYESVALNRTKIAICAEKEKTEEYDIYTIKTTTH